MSVKELEEGEILDDSIGNSDDEGEVKEVSHRYGENIQFSKYNFNSSQK